MNMREVEYWNAVGDVAISSRRENIFKRTEIVRRILARPPINERVLEIGVGKGYTAAAVGVACCGSMRYVGTELAPAFLEFAHEVSGHHMVQTDITALPDGPFDQVWAFDTLEHVKAEDRAKGYAEIDRVLAEHGMIVLNLPLGESLHVGEFEHGITDESVMQLATACRCRVIQWDAYRIPMLNIPYAFVVLKR